MYLSETPSATNDIPLHSIGGRSPTCRRAFRPPVAGLVLCALLNVLTTLPAAGVELVSININDIAGNSSSNGVAVNADGAVVAFYSDATDLVTHDTNQVRDVFLRDRPSGLTERVSLNNGGAQANRDSHAVGDAPAINADGQITAFYSDATNLVPNDTNGVADVFVRLRGTGTTERVSLAADGSQGNGSSINPSISADGLQVAFQSQASNLIAGDTNDTADIFVRDRTAGTTERICNQVEANQFSFAPSISADGNFVAFTSAATNLVPHDVNQQLDIFVCDRRTGVIDLVSVSTGGVQGNGDSILPAISADGRYVAFKSVASNLVPNDLNGVVDVFVRDRAAGTTQRVSVNVSGGDANDASFPPSISYDGRFVAFGSAANNLVIGDVNGVPSVFVRDILTQVTLLVDVNDHGVQANAGTPDVPPSVSGDGRQIGYISLASNLSFASDGSPNDRNQTIDVYIGRNPFFCPDGMCPPHLMCQSGICIPDVFPTPVATRTGATFTPTPGTPTPSGPTVTPPATVGASDCCQCSGPACHAPSNGTCPTDCAPVHGAACLASGSCAIFTPTGPTATSTPTPPSGRNDCCQCEGPACSMAVEGQCPQGCTLYRDTDCLGTLCAITATPTPQPLGESDCCQCGAEQCQAPAQGSCPAQCEPVHRAACLPAGNCATFTPTPTATGSPSTPVPTLSSNRCCQCGAQQCQAPTQNACPAECTLVDGAVCLPSGTCEKFTPTPSGPTATSTSAATPTGTAGATATAAATFTSRATAAPTHTASATASATATGAATQTPVPIPTGAGLDRDACQCAVSADARRSKRGALIWLSGVGALLLRRRGRR